MTSAQGIPGEKPGGQQFEVTLHGDVDSKVLQSLVQDMERATPEQPWKDYSGRSLFGYYTADGKISGTIHTGYTEAPLYIRRDSIQAFTVSDKPFS